MKIKTNTKQYDITAVFFTFSLLLNLESKFKQVERSNQQRENSTNPRNCKAHTC